MNFKTFVTSSASLFLSVYPWLSSPALAQPLTRGPLRVRTANSRYFEDADGDAVLLTGSHVWYNLVDMGPSDPPAPFDFDRYVEWMSRYNHNFMRMWRWDLTQWRWKQVDALVGPHPSARPIAYFI